jgi:hypothetical protein
VAWRLGRAPWLLLARRQVGLGSRLGLALGLGLGSSGLGFRLGLAYRLGLGSRLGLDLALGSSSARLAPIFGVVAAEASVATLSRQPGIGHSR